MSDLHIICSFLSLDKFVLIQITIRNKLLSNFISLMSRCKSCMYCYVENPCWTKLTFYSQVHAENLARHFLSHELVITSCWKQRTLPFKSKNPFKNPKVQGTLSPNMGHVWYLSLEIHWGSVNTHFAMVWNRKTAGRLCHVFLDLKIHLRNAISDPHE